MFDTLDEAGIVARISELERRKSADAAEQARLAVALDAARRAAEEAAGMPARRRGRGVGSEIALARRDSPNCGNRHLGFAKALVHEMPYTLAALEAGQLSEWRATLIVRESACLTVEDRRTLDERMCADQAALDGLGDARIAADAKAIAYELDAQAVVERAAKAATERTVTIRPAPDTMTYVTALLPVAQGVSVYAALKRAADTTFDGRSRNQVMADTLVERTTGHPADQPTPIAVNLVLSDDTLLGAGSEPGWITGYGPIPAAVARSMVAACATATARSTLRRLYRHPKSGALVTMESRARRFPKTLAHFIALRDDTCRMPYCNAPIRHTDHAQPHAGRGATSAQNGLGLCEQCNYVKEVAGWTVRTKHGENQTHTAEFTTPTGHTHPSRAPRPPGRSRVWVSEVETRIAISLAQHAA